MTATPSSRFRQRVSNPASHNAATKPKLTASSVVRLLTSKLFLSRVQFIGLGRESVLEGASPLYTLRVSSKRETKSGESQRDSGSKPRVARDELPWENIART